MSAARLFVVTLLALFTYTAVANAETILRPYPGDPVAVGSDAPTYYTFEGYGSNILWVCDSTMGYFDGIPGNNFSRSNWPIYTPIAPGFAWIIISFDGYTEDGEYWSMLCPNWVNQYEVVLVPDDDYSTSKTPAEPEMAGEDDFVVPKVLTTEQNPTVVPIRLRFRLHGPQGWVPMYYDPLNTGTGRVDYPTHGFNPSQWICHDGIDSRVYIVSSDQVVAPNTDSNKNSASRVRWKTTSSAKGDIQFRMRIFDPGYPEASDLAAAIAVTPLLTSAEIEAVDPRTDDVSSDLDEPSVRIMVNSVEDESSRYHCTTAYTFQDHDHEALVRATVKPHVNGVTVWMKAYDPDDPSVYESDTNPDDNAHAGLKKGFLVAGDGVTIVSGTEIHEGNRVIGCAFRSSASAGEVTAKLNITDRCSGDNYEVRAGFTGDLDGGVPESARTGHLVAWKRYYYELDRMYRPKGFEDLATAFVPDSNAQPDSVEVEDIVGFAVGDEVEVFDYATDTANASSRIAETAYITAVDSNNARLTLDIDLQHAYAAGVSGVATTTRVGYYEADISSWTTALKDARIESRQAESGSGSAPFRVLWETSTNGDVFADITEACFLARGDAYHFLVLGAGKANMLGAGATAGVAVQETNAAFVFIRNLSDDSNYSGNLSLYVPLTSCHEASHNGTVDGLGDCGHQANILGSEYCLMYGSLDNHMGYHMQDADNDGERHLHLLRESGQP